MVYIKPFEPLACDLWHLSSSGPSTWPMFAVKREFWR
jgi:hypothetical protein